MRNVKEMEEWTANCEPYVKTLMLLCIADKGQPIHADDRRATWVGMVFHDIKGWIRGKWCGDLAFIDLVRCLYLSGCGVDEAIALLDQLQHDACN